MCVERQVLNFRYIFVCNQLLLVRPYLSRRDSYEDDKVRLLVQLEDQRLCEKSLVEDGHHCLARTELPYLTSVLTVHLTLHYLTLP